MEKVIIKQDGASHIISGPLSTVEIFFEYNHPGEARQTLQEIKDQLLNRSYPHHEGSIAYDNTLYFFEKVEELITAVHALTSREIHE